MKCKICNHEETPGDFINRRVLEQHQMCFHCNFWREMSEKDSQRPSHTVVMIDGTHYVIAPEDDPETYFRGFAGRKFHIKFNDGTEIITTNLWCQGKPSLEWIDKFPDNAKFLDE